MNSKITLILFILHDYSKKNMYIYTILHNMMEVNFRIGH